MYIRHITNQMLQDKLTKHRNLFTQSINNNNLIATNKHLNIYKQLTKTKIKKGNN